MGRAVAEIAVQPTSLTSAVFRAIRQDIITCRLPPGRKLRLSDLCEQFDCSLGTVREALSRLASEELVVIEDQRGFRVAAVSRSDLLDLTQTRVDIECVALRTAIAKGDADWEALVVGACHRLCREPVAPAGQLQPSEAWATLHQRFHTALLAGCGSPRLLDICGRFYEQSDRYRHLSIPRTVPTRNLPEEHEALARTVIHRDGEAAAALLAEHYWMTTRMILEREERGEIQLRS